VTPPALKIFAGSEALAHIRANGLQPSDIEMLLAASGGPKWLALASMDRYLLTHWFNERTEPLHVLGTSAGAWRMACFAQQNPLEAHARFQEAYLSQQYSAKPTAQEVATECRHVLDVILGDNGIAEIINNPNVRYHTLVARFKGLAGIDQKYVQMLGIAGAMTANLVSPAAMRPWIERVMFHHPEKPPIDHFPHLPARHVALTAENLKPAILASGAIPLVIAGVRNIPGAPKGTYRDGGVTDYQFDLPVMPEKGFVLYPHYFAQAPKGGWFDKKLRWRVASREYYKRTIIIAPSWEFAATLPGGRIPDLDDFYEYPDYSIRRKRWDEAMEKCERLGEELAEVHDGQKWAEVAEPLPW
jgi:hypothetical protein